MSEYKKITKDTIDYPKANLWFMTNVKERLKSKGWVKNDASCGKHLIAAIISDEFPYCWDTVSLIQRKFTDNVWECKLTKYTAECDPTKSDGKWYVYTWELNRKKTL